MSTQTVPPRALARLLDQAARSLHALGFRGDLYPAQWTALRYFDRAQSPHRTASALARFQGMAAGPVTRTVRTLVAKGYLQNVAGHGSARGRQVELTEAGRNLLKHHDPLSLVVHAVEELTPAERVALGTALEHLLRRVQAKHDESTDQLE